MIKPLIRFIKSVLITVGLLALVLILSVVLQNRDWIFGTMREAVVTYFKNRIQKDGSNVSEAMAQPSLIGQINGVYFSIPMDSNNQLHPSISYAERENINNTENNFPYWHLYKILPREDKSGFNFLWLHSQTNPIIEIFNPTFNSEIKNFHFSMRASDGKVELDKKEIKLWAAQFESAFCDNELLPANVRRIRVYVRPDLSIRNKDELKLFYDQKLKYSEAILGPYTDVQNFAGLHQKKSTKHYKSLSSPHVDAYDLVLHHDDWSSITMCKIFNQFTQNMAELGCQHFFFMDEIKSVIVLDFRASEELANWRDYENKARKNILSYIVLRSHKTLEN
jgi:hypothetical protein